MTNSKYNILNSKYLSNYLKCKLMISVKRQRWLGQIEKILYCVYKIYIYNTKIEFERKRMEKISDAILTLKVDVAINIRHSRFYCLRDKDSS